MATLDELGALPPVTAQLDLFDYVGLGDPREPPAVEVVACLARTYAVDEDDDDGLRLAYVAGHPVDSEDLVVLAYLWRPGPEGVVWGAERWSSPQRLLLRYRRDRDFRPRTAAAVHADLQSLDAAAFERHARSIVAR